MPPLVTYNDVEDNADLDGQLFTGKKFFLTQRMPQRSRYIKDIEANGGQLVKLETQADYIIADHLRIDAPPGSLSYSFIEAAIKNGELPSEDTHLAGRTKGTPRSVGSTIPGRYHRVPFSKEDDIELYAWVKDAEEKGVATKGMELYKQLEAMNPRHTGHSWRDRWVKILANRPATVLAGLEAARSDRASSVIPGPATAAIPRATPSTGRSAAVRQTSTTPATPAQANSMAPPSVSSARVAPISRRAGSSARPSTVMRSSFTTPNPPAPAIKPRTAANLGLSTPVISKPVANAQVSVSARISEPLEAPSNSPPPQTEASSTAQSAQLPDSPEKPDQTHVLDTTPENNSILFSLPGFEREDIEDWLLGASTVQDVAVGLYNKSWINFADRHPEHSAAEWKSFYEQVILPIHWQREEERDLRQGIVGDVRYKDLVKIFGTQGQPTSPPSTRHPVTSTAIKVEESAVIKVETSAVLKVEESASVQVAAPEEDRQTGGEASSSRTATRPWTIVAGSPAITRASPKRKLGSAADAPNEAAKRQKVQDTKLDPEPLIDADPELPTVSSVSKVNGIVVISSGAPSEDEYQDEDDADENARRVNVTSPTSEMDAMVQNQLRGEMQNTGTTALTTENLARVQAEHNPRLDHRAPDIAPDDGDKDQGAFAGYFGRILQSAVPGGQISKDGLDALKERHQQFDAQNDEPEDYDAEVEDVENNEGDQIDDDNESILVTSDGRIIDWKNRPAIDTQDVDPNLNFSSPLRQPPPDDLAPLNPDSSPVQSAQIVGSQNGVLHDVNGAEVIDHDMQLDLSEPPGGWDNISSQGSENQDTVPTPKPRDKGKGRAREMYTQDIFDVEPLEPDLEVPDLDTHKRAAELVIDSQVLSREDVEDFMNHCIDQGYLREDILEAFFQTSMRVDLCQIVLESVKCGAGVPTDVAGIWTASDDEALEGSNALKLRYLHAKHGSAGCDARFVFLTEWRSDESQ